MLDTGAAHEPGTAMQQGVWLLLHPSIHPSLMMLGVQLLRAVMLCARRRRRNGTLPRLPPYLWIILFRYIPIHAFAKPLPR